MIPADLPPTERLHLPAGASLLLGFEARVLARAEVGGRPALVLDRTAFYAEAGGQGADHGSLGGARVEDVQLDDAGRVLHVVSGDAPEVGAVVAGRVDEARRRAHRALHTGQHLLSRALLDVAGAETVSARLGETVCTLDVAAASLDPARLAEAEARVNDAIDRDLAVRVLFPSADELARMPLRRAPKVTRDVRVVEVDGFDLSPCGGTHVDHAGEIGLVRVLRDERYKGMTRILFDAGPRARALLFRESDALRALGRTFTCGPLDVAAGVAKVQRERDEALEGAGRLRARLAEVLVPGLLEQARAARTRVVCARLDDPDDAALLRPLAARLVSEGPDLGFALGARSEGGLQVLLVRGADHRALDCGAALRKAASLAGGRGGGKPDRAEGRLPEGGWEALRAEVEKAGSET